MLWNWRFVELLHLSDWRDICWRILMVVKLIDASWDLEEWFAWLLGSQSALGVDIPAALLLLNCAVRSRCLEAYHSVTLKGLAGQRFIGRGRLQLGVWDCVVGWRLDEVMHQPCFILHLGVVIFIKLLLWHLSHWVVIKDNIFDLLMIHLLVPPSNHSVEFLRVKLIRN